MIQRQSLKEYFYPCPDLPRVRVLKHAAADRMFVVPSNVARWIPMWWRLEVGPLGGNQIMRAEPVWRGLVPLQQRPKRASSLRPPCEHTGRAWLSVHQEGRLSNPRSWSFHPPELWQINVCYLSHSAYGILLPQYKQIKTMTTTTGILSLCLFYYQGFSCYFFAFVFSVANMLVWPQ